MNMQIGEPSVNIDLIAPMNENSAHIVTYRFASPQLRRLIPAIVRMKMIAALATGVLTSRIIVFSACSCISAMLK